MPKKKAKPKSRSKVEPKKKTFHPDWKDKSAYPNSETTTGKQWAWEFLRRNPDFQEDCNKLKLNPHDMVHDPPFKHRESNSEYRLRTKSSPYVRKDILSVLLKKWGVSNIREIDSAQTDYKEVRFQILDPVEIVELPDQYDRMEGFGYPQLSDSEILLSFDLSKPLKQLIKSAEYYLSDTRELLKKAGKLKDTRKQVQLYAAYLRLLDAKESKATYSQTAVIFNESNPEEHVKDGLKAAKLLRDRNYKILLK